MPRKYWVDATWSIRSEETAPHFLECTTFTQAKREVIAHHRDVIRREFMAMAQIRKTRASDIKAGD